MYFIQYTVNGDGWEIDDYWAKKAVERAHRQHPFKSRLGFRCDVEVNGHQVTVDKVKQPDLNDDYIEYANIGGQSRIHTGR